MSSKNKVQISYGGDTSDYQKAVDHALRKQKQFNNTARKGKEDVNALAKSFSGAANNVAIFSGPLDPISGRLSAISSGLSRFGLGGVAAAAGFGAFSLAIGKAISASDEYEMRQNRFNALLRATSHQSKLTTKDLNSLADEIGKDTLSSTEDASKGINALLTFKKVQGQTFKDTIKLARDAQVALGGDLTSTVVQFGKALNDPIANLGALSRAGIQFSDTQKEMISNMWEMGDAAGAQAIILDEMKNQFGGLAKEEAKSLSGSFDTLYHNIDRMWENLGQTKYIKNFKANLKSGIDSASGVVESIADAHSKENRELKLQNELFDNVLKTSKAYYKTLELKNNVESKGGILSGEKINQFRKEEAEYKSAKTALDNFNKKREREAFEQAAKDRKARVAGLKATLDDQISTHESYNKELVKSLNSLVSGYETQKDKINRVFSEKNKSYQDASNKIIASLKRQQKSALELALAEGKSEEEKLKIKADYNKQIKAIEDERTKVLEDAITQRNEKLANLEKVAADKLEAQRQRNIRAARIYANSIIKAFSADVVENQNQEFSFLDAIFGGNAQLQSKIDAINNAKAIALETIKKDPKASDAEKQAAKDKLDIESTKRTERVKLDMKKKAAADTWAALETLGKSGNKKAFLIAKAASLAKAGMNTYQAVTNAYANIPPPFNVPAATAIGLAGLAQMNQIRNQQMPQFHDGIDYVPREGTYLLDRGERVLDSRLNMDLKRYMGRQESMRSDSNNRTAILQIPDTGSYNATEQWFNDNYDNIRRLLIQG